MHRRSFASEGTLPKATRRARKRVRGNAETWVSTLQKNKLNTRYSIGIVRMPVHDLGGNLDQDGVRHVFLERYC